MSVALFLAAAVAGSGDDTVVSQFRCKFFREEGPSFNYSFMLETSPDLRGSEKMIMSDVKDDGGELTRATSVIGYRTIHGAYWLSISNLQPEETISDDEETTTIEINAMGPDVSRPANATRILLVNDPGKGSDIRITKTIAVGFCTEKELI